MQARVTPACGTHTLPAQEGLTSTTLDVGVFWVGLFAPGLLWGMLAVGSAIRFNFEWLLLILTALALSMGAHAQPYATPSRAHADTHSLTHSRRHTFATAARQQTSWAMFGASKTHDQSSPQACRG